MYKCINFLEKLVKIAVMRFIYYSIIFAHFLNCHKIVCTIETTTKQEEEEEEEEKTHENKP